MRAHVVVDLGFGDAGKGLMTDHLVRLHRADGVVRFNGGAQAAHNVVRPDGTHHSFHQFGSGTLAGAMTYLSNYMLVNPHMIFDEAHDLSKILRESPAATVSRLAVQGDAVITTPFHIAANRIREIARRQNRHGTCGLGIGETAEMSHRGLALKAKDLHSPLTVRRKLHDIREWYQYMLHNTVVEQIPGGPPSHIASPLYNSQTFDDACEVYRIFAKIVPMFEEFDFSDGTYVFEGAQGILLDEFHGFHPHTTWSKTTTKNAMRIIGDAHGPLENVTTYGVMRSYMTRHGAGPFVTEDPALHECFPEAHNGHGEWQGAWRVGWTDLEAISYALKVCPVDSIAITHLDRVSGYWKVCHGYNDHKFYLDRLTVKNRSHWERLQAERMNLLNQAEPYYEEIVRATPEDIIDRVNEFCGPVSFASYGPASEDVKQLSHV